MRRRRRLGALPYLVPLLALLLAPFAAGLPARPAEAAPACSVTYTIRSQWDTGFTAEVVINNLGDPINGWTLAFAFPGNQRVTNGWSATWNQPANSANVSAQNLSWN